MHRAIIITKTIKIPSPDGAEVRAVQNFMQLIARSLSAAKVASLEMAREAWADKRP